MFSKVFIASSGVSVAVAQTAALPSFMSHGFHKLDALHCHDNEHYHACNSELAAYRDAETDSERFSAKGEAMACVRRVTSLPEGSTFFHLRNLTHVLLDMDNHVKVFDSDPDMVDLGIEVSSKLLAHPECNLEFETKGKYECRCPALYGKVAIYKLKNLNRWEEARSLYKNITSITWNGQTNPVGWEHENQTTQIYLRGMLAKPWWEREDIFSDPELGAMTADFEANFSGVRDETIKMMQSGEDNEAWDDTYRFLYTNGTWSHVTLYKGGDWNDQGCIAFPETCKILKRHLPVRSHIPWITNQQQQALVIKMKPGTTVELHGGPTNNILNCHLGIVIPEGPTLTIDDKTYKWEEGKMIVWDGSFDHSVESVNAHEDRIILLIRYMHPGTRASHFLGETDTHFQKNLDQEELQKWAELETQMERSEL